MKIDIACIYKTGRDINIFGKGTANKVRRNDRKGTYEFYFELGTKYTVIYVRDENSIWLSEYEFDEHFVSDLKGLCNSIGNNISRKEFRLLDKGEVIVSRNVRFGSLLKKPLKRKKSFERQIILYEISFWTSPNRHLMASAWGITNYPFSLNAEFMNFRSNSDQYENTLEVISLFGKMEEKVIASKDFENALHAEIERLWCALSYESRCKAVDGTAAITLKRTSRLKS